LSESSINQLALPSKEQVQKEISRRSADHYIQNFVKIEDRDAVDSDGGDIAVPFILWPGQIKALMLFLVTRLSIVLKARQLGLTWLALAYASWKMVFNAGYAVVALSKREKDAKELTRRLAFILRHLPDWMIQEKKTAKPDWNGPVWEDTTLTITIYHPGKEPSTFRAETSGPDSGRSFTANLVILDEWAFQQYAEDIWAAAYPTINRPTGGQVIGLSTNKRGSLFERICKDSISGKNTFKLIFLDVFTDPRRTPEWYKQSKIDLPLSWMQEYPETIEQAFSAGEETAFPEFSESIHVCKPFDIPAHWRRWRSLDNGYADPFAWYWLTVSEDGIVYIYREFTRAHNDPRLTYSQQAQKAVEMSTYKDDETGREVWVPEKIDFTVAGHDAWQKHVRDESGKTLINYYQDGGVYGFVRPITDRKFRKAVWHEYLKPFDDDILGRKVARVQIFDTCQFLIDSLPMLVVDENDSEKVEESSIDHWYDGAGYGLIAYHVQYTKPPKEDEPPIARHKNKLAKRRSHTKRRLS